MALAKGFARDGFGASWLGFEISVRWTSLPKEGSHALMWSDQIVEKQDQDPDKGRFWRESDQFWLDQDG